MTATSDSTTRAPRAPTTRPARQRALVVAAASGAAVVGWTLAVPLLGVDLQVRSGTGGDQSVGLTAVVAASLTAGALGWALLALLERRTARARTVWTTAAAAVLLLSLLGPLTGARTASAAVTLLALHCVVAAVLIVGLRRTRPRARTAASA